jgi:hypothetical protein
VYEFFATVFEGAVWDRVWSRGASIGESSDRIPDFSRGEKEWFVVYIVTVIGNRGSNKIVIRMYGVGSGELLLHGVRKKLCLLLMIIKHNAGVIHEGLFSWGFPQKTSIEFMYFRPSFGAAFYGA